MFGRICGASPACAGDLISVAAGSQGCRSTTEGVAGDGVNPGYGLPAPVASSICTHVNTANNDTALFIYLGQKERGGGATR